MTTWITICDTCKREDWDAATQTRPHGEDLAALVERAAQGCATVRTRRVAYTLGDFTPDAAAAEAIVAYAALHAESATGQVPYKQWPQGVKGHFVTRHPPLPSDTEA